MKIGAVAQAFEAQAAIVETCMKTLEKSLGACLPMSFLEWVLDKGDKFYEDTSGLFLSLFRDEMGSSPQQMAQVLELRNYKRKQNNDPARDKQPLVDSFRQLEHFLKQKGGLHHADMFDKFRAIFTPRQLALYFKWVAKWGPICLKINV